MPFYPVTLNPRTWYSGPVKTPALRADVDTAVQMLRQPPMFIGSQQNSAQSVPSATQTGVILDTETWDSAGGHNPSSNPQHYYCQLPGYYLAEFCAPLNYAGAGLMNTLIGFSPAGAGGTNYSGGCIPIGPAGDAVMPYAAKLLKMTNPGAPGAAGVDYVQGVVYQTAGSAEPLQVTPAYPQLQVTFVAAATGTQPLAVPANPAWPVPPSYVTSAFLNANIRDTIRFLIYPPVMEAYYNAGTVTLASQASIGTTGTPIPLDTVTYDTYNAFSTGTHMWTAPVAGTYYCYGQNGLTTLATSQSFAAGLTVTSANYNSGTAVTLWEGPKTAYPGAAASVATVRRRLRLNAGDTITLAGFQHDSGGNAATLSGGATASSRLTVIWRSA